MTENGSAYWESVIAKLEADRVTVAGREAGAAAEARAQALPAATGDAAAKALLAKINARRGDLARELETTADALAGAGAKLTETRMAEAAAGQAARLGRLRALTADAVAEAEAFDRAAAAAGAAHAGFMEKLELMRGQGLSSTVYNRLRNRTMMAGALHLAGLGAVVQLPTVSPHHRKTWAEWTRQMCGGLDPRPAPEPDRRAEGIAA